MFLWRHDEGNDVLSVLEVAPVIGGGALRGERSDPNSIPGATAGDVRLHDVRFVTSSTKLIREALRLGLGREAAHLKLVAALVTGGVDSDPTAAESSFAASLAARVSGSRGRVTTGVASSTA